MARPSGVWRRGGGPWYTTIRGQQVWVAEPIATKSEATAALARILAGARTGPAVAITVGDCLRYWLAELTRRVEAGEGSQQTYLLHTRTLRTADQHLGKILVEDLTQADLTRWTGSQKGWKSTNTRNTAISIVCRMLHWCVRQKLISHNPIAGCQRPAKAARAVILTPAQADQLRAAIRPGDRFGDLFDLLRETGCRQGELRQLRADQVDLEAGVATVTTKIVRGGGPVRRVVLSDRALAILRRLIAERPEGILLRTRTGSPWSKEYISYRFWRLSQTADVPGACAHALRHVFVTDALNAGVPHATVAALVGHRGISMIERVYDRTRERIDVLREAIRRARPA